MRVVLNRYPPFRSAPIVVPLRSGKRTFVQEVNVQPGTEELRVKASLNQPNGVIGPYLYDCTRDRCCTWNLAPAELPEQDLFVPHPPPGRWKVLMDVVPAGGNAQIWFYSETVQKRK